MGRKALNSVLDDLDSDTQKNSLKDLKIVLFLIEKSGIYIQGRYI
jgi:hypothetical protein